MRLQVDCMPWMWEFSKTKGGGTTGARGALAPLKFVEEGLSPLHVMALCLLK